MIRILHLSDIHVKAGPRLEDQRAYLDSIVDEGISLEVDLWLLTGDIYHAESGIEERAVLYPQIVRMAEKAPVRVIYGNHDRRGDLERLQELAGDWSIRVFSRAGHEVLETPHGPVSLFLFPYPTRATILANAQGMTTGESWDAAELAMNTLLKAWAVKIQDMRNKEPELPHVLAFHGMIGGGQTAGGEVISSREMALTQDAIREMDADYSAFGHLHAMQEMSARAWYAGAPWFNDFGETAREPGYIVVDLLNLDGSSGEPRQGLPDDLFYDMGDTRVKIYRRATHCRRFITLDYEWNTPPDGLTPEWVVLPELGPELLEAEVRMRLTVPQAHAGSVPWHTQIEAVRQSGAARVQASDIKVIPSQRVRAAGLTEATTNQAKLIAYWSSIDNPPPEAERQQAIDLLTDLEGSDDEALTARLETL